MSLTEKGKANLLRFWKSKDIQNHNLAFQMLNGFELNSEDDSWLWDCYQSLEEKPQHARLINLANLSQSDLLRGRILAVLLERKTTISQFIIDSFYNHSILRIPYNSLIEFPISLYEMAPLVQELIWQDGEIQQIDQNIIQFQQLKRLDLRRQPISYIHPAITELPLLEEIHLISTSFLPDEMMDRKDIEIYTDAPY